MNYAIRTAIEYAVLQMVHEGKELGLWEWKLPVIEETQTINIVSQYTTRRMGETSNFGKTRRVI